MPPVNRLYQELRAQGLEVLLVTFREDPGHVQQVVKERGYVAPVLLDRDGDVTGREYGVWGPPTAFFVDRGGRLVARVIGARDWSTPGARTFVEALLAAKP